MLNNVWQVKCDSGSCTNSIIFDTQPDIVHGTGQIYELGQEGSGWYLGLAGRTANMTMCPSHANNLVVKPQNV